MVNDSRYTIPKVEGKKKHYTTCDINMDDCARQFQHITGQLVNQILHSFYKKILQNLLILREYFRMADEIYWTSVPHFQVKIVHHNLQHVEIIIVPNFPKGILDKYKNVTLCYYLIHINSIGFMNTIYQHILFSIGGMIKNEKIKIIEYWITLYNKL